MGEISIPADYPYQEYLEKQGVDKLSPISFFRFHQFTYKQKDFAGQEYRKLIALVMQQDTIKGRVLQSVFKSQKQNVAQYWRDTQEREKQVAHASAVKDEGRAQSLASVKTVTRDTLRVFGVAVPSSASLNPSSNSTDADDSVMNRVQDSDISAPSRVNDAGKGILRTQTGALQKQAGKRSCPDDAHDDAMSSRKERYRRMDTRKFWHLRSGRDVETVLFEASLDGAATFRMRSYTIDYDCSLTQALFTDEEWSELCEQRAFDLPDLCKTTEQYLLSLRKALNRGDHATTIPIPETDVIACELALISVIQWTQLYKARPSPFDISDTSESFWCREGWPLLRRILGNVDGITMIDGEKTTYESRSRRNKDRRLDVEGQVPRKQKGKNVDMVGRDTRNRKDWFIVESMAVWDEFSTKFLHETDVVLFKELHLLASSRIQEAKREDFVENARFFAVYSGGPGFETFQLRPTKKSPYIFLHQAHVSHILPSAPQSWTRQIQGIAHLLRVKAVVAGTIQHYQRCLTTMEKQDEDGSGGESDGDNPRWLYQDPESLKWDQTLASSPLARLL
ncbi:hypothetical protein BG011_000733 [Mortierella polycephala]|uniref:Uncharacterized protein n=1 Tax=Mortierella polycephala TaxID=41804 RepID=A0A9P6PKV8_9FUNG|nr:hypothetical protein BG011_000733 [Mortierella polycephala]